MPKIHPVLLAGGSGQRLWPLSRKSYPKQFSSLLSGNTLFQDSALRLSSANGIDFSSHIVMTNSDFRFIVCEQLKAIGVDAGQILIEPEAKNTAPAILAASLFVYAKDPEAILLVAPSDHVIPNTEAFHESVKIGLEHVISGKIVMFGVAPTQPEIGYGYLELSEGYLDSSKAREVAGFIEKPDYDQAKKMLDAGNYLWNAGIFLFKAYDLILEFKKFAPSTLKFTNKAVETAKVDLSFLRLNPTYWKEIDDISIDYAIMEKTKNLMVVPYTSNWSDLGEWGAVWSELDKDTSGVALYGKAHSIDCSNTLLRSESTRQQIVGLGLENIIAIAMPDAVLVANKDRSQDVKKVVVHLTENNIPQAEIFPKDHRPWGWFESLTVSDKFQVKRIQVDPGASLSLQSHKYRSEHWIVVSGVAKVTVGDQIENLTEGQSVYVPVGKIHRMENPGKEPMVLIEVQTGTYLGEDDIVRYEDVYNRK